MAIKKSFREMKAIVKKEYMSFYVCVRFYGNVNWYHIPLIMSIGVSTILSSVSENMQPITKRLKFVNVTLIYFINSLFLLRKYLNTVRNV